MSFRTRVAVNCLITLPVLLIAAYWLMTYAQDYRWWENFGLLIVLAIVGGALSSILWSKDVPEPKEGSPEGLTIRIVVSVVTGIAWLVIVVAWWFLDGRDLDIYYVLGVLLLSTLPTGAIMLINWMTWLH